MIEYIDDKLVFSYKISHLFDTSNNIGISCVSRNLYLINDTLQQEENNCQKTNKQTHTQINKRTNKQQQKQQQTTNLNGNQVNVVGVT